MNKDESQDPHHGENDVQQWYDINPERFKVEKELMEKNFPNFKLEFDEMKNAYWEGDINVNSITTEFGTFEPKVSRLKVRFHTKSNYPSSIPEVQDLEEVMKKNGCPHVFLNSNALCYYFGTASELNFEKVHYLKDLYPVIQEFLVKYAVMDSGIAWPDEQLHHLGAFVMEEYKNGSISPDKVCPCGSKGKVFAECHLQDVENYTKAVILFLRARYGRRKLGRNTMCPCGKEKKYKYCCLIKNYFGVVRKYCITLYNDVPVEEIKAVLYELDKAIHEAHKKKEGTEE